MSWDVPDSQRSTVAALDPRTGAMLTDPLHLYGGTTLPTASAGGVWVANGQGHTENLTFHPAGALSQNDRNPVTYAGGGFTVDATVGDHVVLIGGITTLACADPVTGRIRSSAKVPTPQRDAAEINSLVIAGGRLFAYYRADAGPTELLIRLTPPAACH